MSNPITRRSALAGAVASAAALTLTATSSTAGAPTVHEVKIKGFSFKPQHLQVSVGDSIKWTNDDLAPHTATADEFGWDTEEILKDESAELVISEGMETSYFCAFHPHMIGSFEILKA